MVDDRKITRPARSEIRCAKRFWGTKISRSLLEQYQKLIVTSGVSVIAGDLQLLNGRWYVTHAGLFRLARRKRYVGIETVAIPEFCERASCQYAFKATVFTSRTCKGFVGYGAADPSNVSPLVRGAELRVAETRAVNRALRKAYGTGLCSVEELGWPSSALSPSDNHARPSNPNASNGSNNGHPRLRDQLCLLIRKYELDPTLVKRYAADFCGTEALRDASRDLIEAFISTLTDEAAKDRAALICKLNSYNQLEEVKS